MHNTNTLNFYLHSICTHALEVLYCVMLYDVCASWLQLFLPALSLWREMELPGVCSAQTCKIKRSVEFLWENKCDEAPSCLCSLSSPVIPLILFRFRDLSISSTTCRYPSRHGMHDCVCIHVCFADLRLRHEGRGLHLRAVSTGEVLQREVRNLSTAQRLQRPLQGCGPCSGDPGERRWVRTLFTWVSNVNVSRWASEQPLRLKSSFSESPCLTFPSCHMITFSKSRAPV